MAIASLFAVGPIPALVASEVDEQTLQEKVDFFISDQSWDRNHQLLNASSAKSSLSLSKQDDPTSNWTRLSEFWGSDVAHSYTIDGDSKPPSQSFDLGSHDRGYGTDEGCLDQVDSCTMF